MKKVKNLLFCFALTFIISFSFLVPNVNAAYSVNFDIYSQSVYLVNTDTNTIVYEKDADKKLQPAYLAQIMTAILTIEKIADLENTVITSPAYIYDEFAGQSVATADIRRNEDVKAIDLLYAMILQSSCEAASTVANYLGDDSITDFVEMMNQKAKEIGAVNTVFQNPHGLYDEDQYTTAKDMYLITSYALKYPIFEKVCTSKTYLMPKTNVHSEERYLVHTNYMLSKSFNDGKYYYQYASGIKAGALTQTGRNLITRASYDGYNYMLVIMGAPFKDENGTTYTTNKCYEDAKAIFSWAFTNFSQTKVLSEGEVVDEIPIRLSSKQDYISVVTKSDSIVLLPKDVNSTALQKVIITPDELTAPIKKGDVLGRLNLKLADEVIASVDLVASEDVSRGFGLYALDITGRFFKRPLVILLCILLALLILIFWAMVNRYSRMKRRQRMRSRRR